MQSLDTWSDRSSLPRRERAERRPVPDLSAYHWSGAGLKQEGVKNISSTGLYLVTQERWLPGEAVSLTLQRKGPPETIADRRITLKTVAVRWGEDGVALSFILPRDLEVRLWDSPLKSSAEHTEPEDILREFRMAEAIAFLNHICPPLVEEARVLLREGLSNYRVASSVEIAFKAQEMLAASPDLERLRIHPKALLRILEDGSWAEAEWIQELWAGLLATSCTLDGKDESGLMYSGLLSQLTPIHLRIFVAACTRAKKVFSGLNRFASRPVSCSTEEIMKITGSRDMLRIERDLEHLTDLGLLEKRDKSAFYLSIDSENITPTPLGLQLYARCHGHRDSAQDFGSQPESVLTNESKPV
ncbi:MAG TPA: hypothetical protein VKR52_06705 [Terracidiphilus sp.]|nr:hypothetical protein [Terracidiphilus sp.]